MAQTTFTCRTVTSRKGDYEIADHAIEKKESRKLSRLQAFGYWPLEFMVRMKVCVLLRKAW